MVWLAWRASGSRLAVSGYVAIILIVFAFTLLGTVALTQNQPQILVSFLLVLTIERARAGADFTAGAVLALSASLKLYPALFFLLLLLQGRWRACLGFLAIGAALALASLMLAGWPLHRAFLAVSAAMSRTIMLTPFSFGLDQLVAQVVAPDTFTRHFPAFASTPDLLSASWFTQKKSVIWQAFAYAALLLLLVIAGRSLRRAATPQKEAALWAFVLATSALLLPVGWVYYFIPAVAFLPILVDRFGLRAAVLVMATILAPVSLPGLMLLATFENAWFLIPVFGCLSMAALALAFGVAPFRPCAAPPDGYNPRNLRDPGGLPCRKEPISSRS